MKKFFLTSTLLLLIAGVSFAQSEKFVAAMKKNLAALDTSYVSTTAMQNVSNSFERIATAEKTEWLPYYYAAYCQVMIAFMEKDKSKTDAIADKANEMILKADSLSANNSEIACVRSMVATCHMLVNPQERWMQYGKESGDYIEKAKVLDPNNPRPYLLKSESLRYTPEQFGGGCKSAAPVMQTALEKFETFTPVSDIHPNWGKYRIDQLIEGCK